MTRILAACLVLAACAQAPRSRMATGTVVSDQEARAVIRRALEADATGQPADTLYSAGATVIANGRARLSPPRFAGVGRGGRLAIQTLSVELGLPVAWGTARYVWVATDGGAAESGEATFVLERTDRGWLIVHAHSSVPPPWEAAR